MKPPVSPPRLDKLIKLLTPELLPTILDAGAKPGGQYLHWDKLRHLTPPDGLSSEQWWLGIKLARGQARRISLLDVRGRPFSFTLPDEVLSMLHAIDSLASGRVVLGGPVVTEELRNRFIFNSLVEEAITSSQLEGASTTRQVAADMIRYQRAPKDRSERMIMNNYLAMQSLRNIKDQPLSYEGLLSLHATLARDTLDDPGAAGRIQIPGEDRVQVVDHSSHRILHTPPPAEELPARLNALVSFANEDNEGGQFIHPVVRAIILHFWLAYEHPFLDGNGRTARALFYWTMLRRGYLVFEFISISRVLKQAPAKYARSFLYTETDNNDLTYFIIEQVKVIEQALKALEVYLGRKAEQLRRVEGLLRRSDLNHREIALLSHAIRHPGHEYTVKSHQISHRVAYATARADVSRLAELELLHSRRIGKKTLAFIAPDDLEKRIKALRPDK